MRNDPLRTVRCVGMDVSGKCMGSAVARSVLSGDVKPGGGLAEGLGGAMGALGGREGGVIERETAARGAAAKGADAKVAAAVKGCCEGPRRRMCSPATGPRTARAATASLESGGAQGAQKRRDACQILQ